MTLATPMKVKVLLFGQLKEVAAFRESEMELAEGSAISDLFAKCALRSPGLLKFQASTVPSRNQEFADWSTPLFSGDEVAFLPPVSGG